MLYSQVKQPFQLEQRIAYLLKEVPCFFDAKSIFVRYLWKHLIMDLKSIVLMKTVFCCKKTGRLDVNL